jgi:hypothetical protein
MAEKTTPSRAGARVKRPASVTPEGFERMREDAFVHLLAVIGLSIYGDPQPGEPLAVAAERVRTIIGGESPGGACSAAGCEAVRGESDDVRVALNMLIARLPAWLAEFTLVCLDTRLWGLVDPVMTTDKMAPACVREARLAWPSLPAGAYTVKG